MLNEERIKALLEIGSFDIENIFIVNCLLNQIEIPAQEKTLKINEAQKRLLLCVAHQINSKQDIISVVWNDNHRRVRDNNYHQLIFQTRNLFERHGIPPKILLTVPYYGVKLNTPLLRHLAAGNDAQAENTEEKKSLIPHLISLARGLF